VLEQRKVNASGKLKISCQSTTLFSDFPAAEYTHRVKRLRKEMEAQGIDALLLTEQQNVRYVSGMYDVGWIIPAYFHAVVLPLDQNRPAALFVPEGNQIQSQASWVDSIIRWDFPVGFYAGEIGAHLVQSFTRWFWYNTPKPR
jgi:Xaa-Pro aminopeptidase